MDEVSLFCRWPCVESSVESSAESSVLWTERSSLATSVPSVVISDAMSPCTVWGIQLCHDPNLCGLAPSYESFNRTGTPQALDRAFKLPSSIWIWIWFGCLYAALSSIWIRLLLLQWLADWLFPRCCCCFSLSLPALASPRLCLFGLFFRLVPLHLPPPTRLSRPSSHRIPPF